MKAVQKGFTLIELMIVIAIIGILAAIAIPAYQNYTIRSQVSEGLSLADAWKAAIAEFYQNNGSWPAGFTSTGSSTTVPMLAASVGKYVGSEAVDASGNIKIVYSGTQASTKLNAGGANTLFLQAALNSNNDVIWVCGTATAPSGVSVVASEATTIPAQYLPASCHP